MKYKVVGRLCDLIIANKNYIKCIRENGVYNDNGDSMENINVGDVLTDKNIQDCDTFWSYTRKEWEKLDNWFKKEQIK